MPRLTARLHPNDCPARPAGGRFRPSLVGLDAVAELDTPRHLVRREVASAVIDDLFGAALRLHDDARDDHRAGHRIGDDRRLRLLDLRERLEATLDLADREALAIDLHDVVFTT